MIAPRTRKCAVCRTMFARFQTTQKVCSTDCAIALVMQQKAKLERKRDRERKQALKTRSDYIREAQTAFNRYIRARDADRLCICCGLPLGSDSGSGGDYDCGHYRSVGSAPHLRFDERNAHAQRKQCNRWGAGRAVDYRIRLIFRIGLPAVEDLEATQGTAKWSIVELVAIRDRYRAKLRELKKNAYVEAA